MKGSRNCAVNETEWGACARSRVAASFLITPSRQSLSSCRNVSSGEPRAGRLYVAGGGELAGVRCAARKGERNCERRKRKPRHWLPPLRCRAFPSDAFWSRTFSFEAAKVFIGACTLLCQTPHHHGTGFQPVQAPLSGSMKSRYRFDGLAFSVASQTLTVWPPLFPRKLKSSKTKLKRGSA